MIYTFSLQNISKYQDAWYFSIATTFSLLEYIKVKVSIKGLEWSREFQEVEAPRFQGNWHMKVERSLAPRTGRLYPQETFLVLISVRG
jgi:hypothetical protein